MTDEELMNGWIMAEVFNILVNRRNEFTADDVHKLALERGMTPDDIKRQIGASFREHKAAGYIEKTDRFKLSERNGSAPLPIWRVKRPCPGTAC